MPQYSGVWNLAQQVQALNQQQWVTDPQFKNTTLLLQADAAANGSQNNTFIDSSGNSFPITRNGNITQGSFTPFSAGAGYWGNYFNGSTDYLTYSASGITAFNLSTGDWTIEAWIYRNVSGASHQIFNLFNAASNNQGLSFYVNAANQLTQDNGNVGTTAAGTVPAGAWTHVAAVRTSGNTQLYINGIAVGSAITQAPLTAQYINIGITAGNQSFMNGYLAGIRIIKGQALTSGNFTPPTSPLTTTSVGWTGANVASSVTGTVALLTCQYNRFFDASGTVPSLSTGGTPSIQAFSPFAPQYQYTTPVIGGSGYFDGSGDYLTAPTNADFAYGAGDFTMECWVYPTTALSSGFTGIAGTMAAGGGLLGGTNTYIQFNVYGTANGVKYNSPLPVNAWSHLAYSRTASVGYLFLNGALVASGADANNYSATSNFCVGSVNAGQYFNGYISGFRYLKGTALYTSTFSPPTAPPAAITNTKTLLNFTNAGIYDGTMKNVFETVGNAQVSTAVVKYGSGSLYFDGSGDYIRNVAASVTFLQWWRGEYTLEYWIYPLAFTQGGNTDPVIIGDMSPTASNNFWSFGPITNGTVRWYYFNGSAQNITTTQTIPLGQWTHLAMVQRQGVVYIYINGVLATSSAYSGTPQAGVDGTNYLNIGSANNASFNGYLDDVRITLAARYTRNFTPPQVALPRQ